MIRSFMAFESKEDSFEIDNLSIINDANSITLDGVLSIEKNRKGMEKALELKRVIDATVAYLKEHRLHHQEDI